MKQRILAAVLILILLLPAFISAGSLLFAPKNDFSSLDSAREYAISGSLKASERTNNESIESLTSEERYIVKFKHTASLDELENRLADVEFKPLSVTENRIFALSNAKAFIEQNKDIIEYYEADVLRNTLAVTNDPIETDVYEDLGIYSAWDSVSASRDVIVAVLDTGVDRSHEDIADANILAGYDAVTGAIGVYEDEAGHGTGVVGIIAATSDNGLGIAGVASGVTVLPIKVSASSTAIYSSDLISGIRFAADAGAKIINMSVGGYSYSYAEQEAVNYAVSKGCILISAAGNGGQLYGDQKSYPASYDGVISVASCDASGSKSYFSQYNDAVDVTAYGENLNIIYRDGELSAYRTDSGTSYSCAIVSGIAALAAAKIDKGVHFGSDEFLALIIDTCGSYRTDTHGYGIINADDIVSTVNLPIVTGVVNGKTYSERVTVGFNRGTATLDGYSIENGETVMSNGRHTLVVTDGDAKREISFRLKYDPLSYNFKEFANYAYFEFNRGSATLDGIPYKSGERIVSSGIHHFVITDGDEILEKQIKLEYALPTVYGIEDGGVYTHPVNIQIIGSGDAELNGTPVYGEATVAESGEYTLTVYSGNGGTAAEYHFTVDFDACDIFEGDYALASAALDEENGYFCLYGESLVGVRIYDINFPDTYLHFLPVGRVYSHAFRGDSLLLFGENGITVIDRAFALEGETSVTQTVAHEEISLYAYGNGTVYGFGSGNIYTYDLEGDVLEQVAELEQELELALYSDGYFCLSTAGDAEVWVLDCATYELNSFDISGALLNKPRAVGEGYYSVGNRLYDIATGALVLEFGSEYAVMIRDGLLYSDNRIIDIATGDEVGSFALSISEIAIGEIRTYLFGSEEIFATVENGPEGIFAYGAAQKTDAAFSSFGETDSYRTEGFYDGYSEVLSSTASESNVYIILLGKNAIYGIDRAAMTENTVIPLRFEPISVRYSEGYIAVCFASVNEIYVAPEEDILNGIYITLPAVCTDAFVSGGDAYAVSGGMLVSVTLDGEVTESGAQAEYIAVDGDRILSVYNRVLTAYDRELNAITRLNVGNGRLFVGSRLAVGRELYNSTNYGHVRTIDSEVIALGGSIAVLKNGIYDVTNLENIGVYSVRNVESAIAEDGAVIIFGDGIVSVVSYPDGSALNTQPSIGGVEADAVYLDTVSITYERGIGFLDGTPFASGDTVSRMGRHEFLLALPFGRVFTVEFIVETHIKSIEFLVPEQLMSVGETISLGIKYLPDGASSVPVRFSCDSDGLYLDETGKVTALAVGEYTVIATVETEYGSFTAESRITVSDKLIAFPPESGLTVNRNLGYIFGVAPSTRAEELISMLSSRGGAVVANKNGEVITGFVGTGCRLILYDVDGTFSDELTIVVVGDPDGDGYISAYDLFVLEHILSGAVYTEACVLASDIVADGVITDSDRRALKSMLLEKENPNANNTADNLFGSCTVQTVSKIESGDEIEVAVCISGSKYARGVMGNIAFDGLEFLEATGTGWETAFKNHGDSISFYAFGTDGSVCGRAFKILINLKFKVTAQAGEDISLSAENVKVSFENGCRNLRFENASYTVSEPTYGEFGIEIFNASDFIFEPDKNEYSVSIPYNNALLDLYVTHAEDCAVSVSSLVVPDSGESLITVRVLSADGSVRYYYINATREKEPIFETNCRLSTLEIEGFRLTPSFDPDVYNYSVTVPYETAKLNIYCVAQNSLEQVIVGDTTLEGENKIIEILVVSPDGESRTYTIEVTVEPPLEESEDTDGVGNGNLAVYIWIGAVILIGLSVFLIYKKKLSRPEAEPAVISDEETSDGENAQPTSDTEAEKEAEIQDEPNTESDSNQTE